MTVSPTHNPAHHPAGQDADQLAARLREGTRQSHTAAENTLYMKCFLQGIVVREAFRKLLANLYWVYGALEAEVRSHLDHPAVAGIYFPELERQGNLLKDLQFYYGDDWQTTALANEVGRDYVARIHEVASFQPELLVAHAYVRYMGDLSGGQGLRTIARKALSLPPDQGTGLHDFATLPTPDAKRDFKFKYRDALNGLPVTEAQIKSIVAEANRAFQLNYELVHSLEDDLFNTISSDQLAQIMAIKQAGSTENELQFDAGLIQKYDRSLPRYTSYPPATELKPEFQEADLLRAIARGNEQKTPLSLYCHIPFCDQACYFCGCNTVITKRRDVAAPYLDYLTRHIRRVAEHVAHDRPVNQLHWGGGTPNYLTIEQVQQLWDVLQESFWIAPDAELSIEVNPRLLDRDYVLALRQIGFNRVSFGIQDFDTQVQEAINRVQPEEMLFESMGWLREAKFDSVNVDLIYGLPFQSLAKFEHTLTKTLELNPDRVAVFNFAYMPSLKPIQKRIPADALPPATEKLAIFQRTIDVLSNNGYTFIGMDHFAKPGDELAIAQRQGELHRNFQGYTTKPEADLLGFGMTSISMLHDVYTQNQKHIRDYYKAIDQGGLSIERGVALSQDDVLRRSVVMELMCQFRIERDSLVEKYQLDIAPTLQGEFAREYAILRSLEKDGLVRLATQSIEVTPLGRLLVRNIASVFDQYLGKNLNAEFSKAV